VDELQADSTGEPPCEGHPDQSFRIDGQRLPPEILQNGEGVVSQDGFFHIEQADHSAAGRQGGHVLASNLRVHPHKGGTATQMIAHSFHKRALI